jgi:hypothetical protein
MANKTREEETRNMLANPILQAWTRAPTVVKAVARSGMQSSAVAAADILLPGDHQRQNTSDPIGKYV